MPTHNCGHLLSDLSLYLDGEASEAVCAEIEQHLQNCEDCQVMVNTLEKTVYLVRSLPQPGLPGDVRERLFKKLDLTEFLEKEA
ncbi:MAG: zf-HC2 domain-containing protein [Anaerolineales bacterium]|nr:zf-HC2 domain-containing protein [Anaerolineales bacterium]